jgi:hypothetical protein
VHHQRLERAKAFVPEGTKLIRMRTISLPPPQEVSHLQDALEGCGYHDERDQVANFMKARSLSNRTFYTDVLRLANTHIYLVILMSGDCHEEIPSTYCGITQ